MVDVSGPKKYRANLNRFPTNHKSWTERIHQERAEELWHLGELIFHESCDEISNIFSPFPAEKTSTIAIFSEQFSSKPHPNKKPLGQASGPRRFRAIKAISEGDTAKDQSGGFFVFGDFDLTLKLQVGSIADVSFGSTVEFTEKTR